MIIPNDLSILRCEDFVIFGGKHGAVILRKNEVVLLRDYQDDIYFKVSAMILSAVLEAIR